MANNYFRFKQFIVHQDKCAMKVCTDACLFGAWIAEKLRNPKSEMRNVLDIGTGTGLLALMYAQKNPDAVIDAVEIVEAAAYQAKENVEASPWKKKLRIYNTAIQQFSNSRVPRFHQTIQPINPIAKYDLIFSNPPFFKNDLKSNDDKRNLALHSKELSFEELLDAADKNLKEDGSFAVLLAYHLTEQFIALAKRQYFNLQEKLLVKQTPAHNYFRSILLFARQEVSIRQSGIIIQNGDGKYTTEFVELLKDYYLTL